MLSPSFLENYYQTNYCFGNIILNINKSSSKAATILRPFTTDGGLFITAWNPLGKELTVEYNEQANKTLKAELFKENLNVIDGYSESADGAWREDSFFAYPIDEETNLKLCCTFHQNSLVYISSD